MRKVSALLALILLAGLSLFVAPSANATVICTGKAESLEIDLGTAGKANMDIDYSLCPIVGGQRDLQVEAMLYFTTPNCNADKMSVSFEKTPGHYVPIVAFGGDGTPQNTVSTDWTSGERPWVTITDTSDTPAWQFKMTGCTNNNAVTGTDYGVI